jgi:tetratricopeptide (TPR) repeat protein
MQISDKALAIKHKSVLTLLDKGLALNNFGRYKEAIECYDKVLAIKPNDIDALNGKGYPLDGFKKI